MALQHNRRSRERSERYLRDLRCTLEQAATLDGLLIREQFREIDLVKECRWLFEQLENNLLIEREEYYQDAVL